MPFSRRFYYALMATVICLALSYCYRKVAVDPVNDLYFPFCGAKALIRGLDPYGGTCIIEWNGHIYPPNPLTTILIAVPFTPLKRLGPLLLWSMITGLLVFGLLKDGKYWRLLTLLSAPYWNAFLYLQWSPLILAIAFLPSLLPLALIKPQTGLPIILTNLTWRRLLACIFFLLLPIAIDSTWPLRWFPQAKSYDGYIPILVLPIGLLLLLSIIRWREKQARFLLFMSIVPQRGIYDLLSLWSILTSPKQIIILNILSWLLFICVFWLHIKISFPILSITFIYLPLIFVVLYLSKNPPYFLKTKQLFFEWVKPKDRSE